MTLHLLSCEDAPPDVRLTEFHADADRMEATFKGDLIQIIAEGLVEQFHLGGGVNYIEWTVLDPDEGLFTLTMQRRDGSLPGEVVAKLRELGGAVVEGRDGAVDALGAYLASLAKAP